MTEERNPSPAEVYGRYLGAAIADPFTRVLLEVAAPQRGERVLDLACGTGSVARQVAPMAGEEGAVVGLDINPAMLDVARALPAPRGRGDRVAGGQCDRALVGGSRVRSRAVPAGTAILP